MIRIKKGLDLPIEGNPEQKIYQTTQVSKVAMLGDDFVGMKPTMHVQIGDKVQTGQVLFSDKKIEGVNYTSPASGEVIAINRGNHRVFESLVIKVHGDDHVSFTKHIGATSTNYTGEKLKELLLETGLWTAIRKRPYSKVANPHEKPSSLFITAIDTHPMAANPEVVIADRRDTFELGVKLLSKLTPKTFLCVGKGSQINIETDGLKKVEFDGPHPAGLVGTHIHFLDPVGEKKIVWHIGYQDVIALGELVKTGRLFNERVISIAGPVARNPRLVKVRLGACISEMVKEEVFEDAEIRAVSGSVLGGRAAKGPYDFLGRYHSQVSLLKEGRHRDFLGWHSPGLNKFSVKPIYLSWLFGKKFGFDTNTNGSYRSIVPIGSFEKVMPLDILPTHLLRYLCSPNVEMCTKLGALELDEEDLALCTFVDPSKNDYGPRLREKLTIIEKEG